MFWIGSFSFLVFTQYTLGHSLGVWFGLSSSTTDCDGIIE